MYIWIYYIYACNEKNGYDASLGKNDRAPGAITTVMLSLDILALCCSATGTRS